MVAKAIIHGTGEDITMQIRQILAPTDFSEFSKQAVAYAYELAETFSAKLCVLHVVELQGYPVEVFPPSAEGTTLIEDMERRARLDLARLLPQAQDGMVEVRSQVVVGTPYYKIVEVAEAERVELIVMATHGRTGFSHLVMGSVAERMVRLAPCPVLTIRPTSRTV
jgi:nucleotide-binding universal stress UspA family protein